MSSITVSGNASGTGIFTIASPNSNTNRTISLPDNTGTIVTTGSSTAITQSMIGTGVAGTGPAFSAYQSSAQTALTSTTWTKIQFQTEEFDTANCFDSTTNYRFTPNVAGYYQLTALITVATSATTVATAFYKNGSVAKYGNQVNSNGALIQASALIYFNGSTDYVEFYALFVTSQSPVAAATSTYFQGFLARAD